MSVIADFAVPPEDFVLTDTVRNGPDMTVEVERVVARTGSTLTPYFRAIGDEFEAFEDVLHDDETVAEVTTLERIADERFYRARWTRNVEHLAAGLRDVEATVVRATSEDSEWDLRMVFDDREVLREFHDHCNETYDYNLRQVFERSNTATFGEYEVTPQQRDTLVTALEDGYFEVPRDVTMDELAEEFDITVQSISQRMRRGHANLLRNTLAPPDHDAEE